MTDTRVRRGLFVVLGVLAVAAVVTAFIKYDPDLSEIRVVALGYVGDLQLKDLASASNRVYPDDLLELKSSSLDLAGTEGAFRRQAEEFFGTRDPEVIRSQSKLRFFELMVWRTFDQNPDIHEALRRGEVIGVSTDRDGDDARADITLHLATADGDRQIQVHLKLARDDDQWWIRI